MPGHPDGQNYAIWRGPDFLVNTALGVSASVPLHVAGQVTNYASIFLTVNPTTCPDIVVSVKWYTDSTLTVLIKSHSWKVPLQTELSCIIPALGNFVTLDATTVSVPGGTVQVSLLPTNTPADAIRYLSTGNRVQRFQLSVPASSTVTDTLPEVVAGNGYIYIADPNTTAHLTGRIVTLDETGASVTRLISWNTLTAFQAQQFTTDAEALRVEVDNTDAAAPHVVNYYVSVDGR